MAISSIRNGYNILVLKIVMVQTHVRLPCRWDTLIKLHLKAIWCEIVGSIWLVLDVIYWPLTWTRVYHKEGEFLALCSKHQLLSECTVRNSLCVKWEVCALRRCWNWYGEFLQLVEISRCCSHGK